MTVTVVKTPQQQKQNRIYQTLVGLTDLPKVSLRKVEELDVFEICHEQEFVPNFRFVWCTIKEHYRVYIHVADRDCGKMNAGYTICTVGTRYAAMGFGVLYGFLHKHRANNRETA